MWRYLNCPDCILKLCYQKCLIVDLYCSNCTHDPLKWLQFVFRCAIKAPVQAFVVIKILK